MTTAELLRQLERATGPIYGALLAEHDAYHVRLVKADLIACLAYQADPDGLAPFELIPDGDGLGWILVMMQDADHAAREVAA